MPVRTLQRRLAHAGITYARLVAKIRFDMAARRLADPKVKLLDIALDLGYSDHAHFTRAFRRWTGTTPREFRQQKLRESPSAPVAGPRPCLDATRQARGSGEANFSYTSVAGITSAPAVRVALGASALQRPGGVRKPGRADARARSRGGKGRGGQARGLVSLDSSVPALSPGGR
jgi:AraC-like DNA-binding protein